MARTKPHEVDETFHTCEGEAQAIPYHALLCEILSVLLGIKCAARTLIPALLDESASDIISAIIVDCLSDEDIPDAES